MNNIVCATTSREGGDPERVSIVHAKQNRKLCPRAVYLCLKDVKKPSYEEAYEDIVRLMKSLYAQHMYLLRTYL